VIFSKKSCFGHAHLPSDFYKVFHCLRTKISPDSESSAPILGIYVKILQKYVELGSKPKAIEGTDVPLGTFKSYLARNFPKMVKFVRELEEEEAMDEMIEKHWDALERLKDHD